MAGNTASAKGLPGGGGCYDSSQHSFILPDDLSYLTLAEDRVQATPLSEFLVFYLFPGLKSYWDQSDRFHSSNGADTFINMFKSTFTRKCCKSKERY